MTKKTISWFKSGMLAGALMFLGGGAFAADPPVTSDVLSKLHESDQKEIEAGKLAQKNGQSQQVRDYGKMLVKDHTAADKKVAGLAKKEKVNLTEGAPSSMSDMSGMAGSNFDRTFARDMVDDHKKDIAEVTEARDNTKDENLKKLLTDLLPTLQKHEEAAQKIVDDTVK